MLSWEKGAEQSGFVWCNPPELLPTLWGRGVLAQDKLHTHAHARALDTQAPCSPSGLAEQGHVHLWRNLPRASHDCSGRHLSVSWGWFQHMHCSTAGTAGHNVCLGACETGMKSAVPWLHPDCSKAAVHAPQHQRLGTLPLLPAPVDSENILRISLAQKPSGVCQPKGFPCPEENSSSLQNVFLT